MIACILVLATLAASCPVAAETREPLPATLAKLPRQNCGFLTFSGLLASLAASAGASAPTGK